MIDPAKLREQRTQTRRPPKPTGFGCFDCGRSLGEGNWYGLCVHHVHKYAPHKRQEFREKHLKRMGRAS